MLRLDVTACRTTHGRPFFFYYFSPTSCFELRLSAFPLFSFYKQMRVPRGPRLLDVGTQAPPRRLLKKGWVVRGGSALNTYLSAEGRDTAHLSRRT